MNKLLFYQIFFVITLYLGYTFYIFTRKSIIFLIPHFNCNSTSSINITKYDIGIIISAQNFAYTISKLLFGLLSDISSNRILFGSGLFISGLLNIGVKKDIDIYNLYFQSFLIGLAQGPAWPSAAKILQQWLPPSQFATWWSVISTGSNLAGALGPLLATSIAVQYHWSYVMLIPGCICMSMGYLAIIVLRNKPSDVGLTNFDDPKKNESLEADIQEMGRIEKTKLVIKSPFFLSICLAYFFVQLLKTLYSDWSSIYLNKTIGIDAFKSTYFVSLFEIFGLFGSIFSGIMSDYVFYIKKSRSLKKNQNFEGKPITYRLCIVLIYLLGIFVFLHLFNFNVRKSSANMMLIYSIAAISGFLIYGCISLLGVMAMEFTSTELSGTAHSLASLSANFGSIFAGIPFSIISKIYSWNKAFKIVQIFLIFVFTFVFIFRNTYFEDNRKINIIENKYAKKSQ